MADARQYDFDRDQTYGEIKELLAEALARRETIDLLKDSILPKSEQALEIAARDYATGSLDFLTLNSARQDVLRIQLEVARIEAELSKTLASLERAVGVELNGRPARARRASPIGRSGPRPVSDRARSGGKGESPSLPSGD